MLKHLLTPKTNLRAITAKAKAREMQITLHPAVKDPRLGGTSRRVKDAGNSSNSI